MYFINNGGQYIQQEFLPEVHNLLEAGVYILKFNPVKGYFYLEKYNSFKVTNKVYGDLDHMMKDILHAYNTREVSTGISLQGFLGSGKTMLAKKVANKFVEEGGVVILINDPFTGVDFYQFLQNIQQDHMLLFEEFDKTYIHKEQIDSLLTLFDGIFSKRRLILLTSNDKLPEYFTQRPSRVLYKYEFKHITNEVIVEICNDFNVPEIIHNTLILNNLYHFNFDSIFALIEEYKRNQRDVKDIIDYLNIIPKNITGDNYEIVDSNIVFTSDDTKELGVRLSDTFFSVDRFGTYLTTEEDKYFSNLRYSLKNITNISQDTLTFEKEFIATEDVYDDDDEYVETKTYKGIATIKIASKPIELDVKNVL